MTSTLELRPLRALLHPAWVLSVALLALNDHVFKGSGLLPPAVTGKLSDAAGLFAAPALLAALCGVRGARGLGWVYAATGLVFAAIKVSPQASGLFTGALGLLGLPWRNWVDPTDLLALPALGASYLALRPAMEGGARRRWGERAAVLLGLPAMLASGNSGGANEGAKAPGSGDKGVDLSVGEIAVDPQGRYFVSKVGDRLMAADIDGRTFRELPGVPTPRVLAFWPASRGQGFFLIAGQSPGEKVLSYNLADDKIEWSKHLSRDDDGLQVDPTGGRVALWSSEGLLLLSSSGDELGSFKPSEAGGLVDVDLIDDRLILTSRGKPGEDKLPVAEIEVRSSADLSGVCAAVKVPNCADELVLIQGGKRALLAPTFCGRDPVSVVDLEGCKFEKNLPGFGPVALSSNGKTAVAFLDRDNSDPMAPPVPEEVKTSKSQYHLMFIDTDTLAFGTAEVGDKLPRYAVTPDGQLLLVDSAFQDSKSNVRIVDVNQKLIRDVTGPSVALESYALLPDSTAAYAIHQSALYRVDIVEAKTSVQPLDFTPMSLNITPKGDRLLLRDPADRVHLFSLTTRSQEGVFAIAP